MREFFLLQGHQVASLKCPIIAAFQAACPQGALLTSLAELPAQIFTKEYARIQELALAAMAAAIDVPPVPGAPPDLIALAVISTSILEHYSSLPLGLSLGPSGCVDPGQAPPEAFPPAPTRASLFGGSPPGPDIGPF